MSPTGRTRDQHADIKCYCVDIHAPSEVSRCPSSPKLTIESAQNVAQILELPLLVLDEVTSAKTGVPIAFQPSSDDTLLGKQIVCGKGDEVQQEFPSAFDELIRSQEHDQFVNRVGTSLVLFLFLLIVGHVAWNRFVRRRWHMASSHVELDSINDEERWEGRTLHENDDYTIEWIKKSREAQADFAMTSNR